jgi:hypothetical protein
MPLKTNLLRQQNRTCYVVDAPQPVLMRDPDLCHGVEPCSQNATVHRMMPSVFDLARPHGLDIGTSSCEAVDPVLTNRPQKRWRYLRKLHAATSDFLSHLYR